MVLTDVCILFSTVVWFLVTFISFYNFFISNQDFLQILKNLKFRKKKLLKATNTLIMLDSLNPLLKLNHKIVFAWVTPWSRELTRLINDVNLPPKKNRWKVLISFPTINLSSLFPAPPKSPNVNKVKPSYVCRLTD